MQHFLFLLQFTSLMISWCLLTFINSKTLLITATSHVSVLTKPEEDVEFICTKENTSIFFSMLANIQILVYHPNSTSKIHKLISSDQHIVGFHSTIRNTKFKISTVIDCNFAFDVVVHQSECNQIFVSNKKHEIFLIDSVNSNVTDTIGQNICFWYGSNEKYTANIDLNILSTDIPFLILSGTYLSQIKQILLPENEKYTFKGPSMFVWSKSTLPIPRFLSISIDQHTFRKKDYEYSANIRTNEDITYFYNDLYTQPREIKRRRVKSDNQIEFAFRPPPTPTSPLKELMHQIKIPTMVFLLAVSCACFYSAFAIRKPQAKLKRKGLFSKQNIFSSIENATDGTSLFSDFD